MHITTARVSVKLTYKKLQMNSRKSLFKKEKSLLLKMKGAIQKSTDLGLLSALNN